MAILPAESFVFSLDRDDEGFRQYRVTQLVQTTTPLRNPAGAGWTGDGPASILGAAGLAATGETWTFGNDNDPWAFCLPTKRVRLHTGQKQGENQVWAVESVFSTRPLNRCMTTAADDPLDEPQKVRGNSVRYTIEATKDRNGDAIVSSSHEPFRGPQVEFDGGRDQVIIEQNVADLELGLVTSLRNKLNDDTLWGLAARRVKFSDFSWEELWYGTCTHYYRRIFTFDIRNDPEDLFDRTLLDEGTKVLNGRWSEETGIWQVIPIPGFGGQPDPDKTNPQHFIRYKDRNGENSRVVLDGNGLPAASLAQFGTGTVAGTGTDATDPAGQHLIEYYDEADLTQLNIPTDLDFGTAAS